MLLNTTERLPTRARQIEILNCFITLSLWLEVLTQRRVDVYASKSMSPYQSYTSHATLGILP